VSNPVSAAEKKRLSTERNIWIVTVHPDGRPHIVPVWFTCLDTTLYVCIEPRSVKGRNLVSNKNVCLALEDGNHPVICEGKARFVERPWPEAVITAFRDKYGWDISSEQQYTELVEVAPDRWLVW